MTCAEIPHESAALCKMSETYLESEAKRAGYNPGVQVSWYN